jgi:uncharacterized protein
MKETTLKDILVGLGRVAVAYSGGTDSSFLLSMCLDVLRPTDVLALTADSPLVPRAELAAATRLAASLDARHLVLPFDDLADEAVAANSPERCYHCKLGRFGALLTVAHEQGFAYLLHGENADDRADYRPGSRAAQELGVRAPLREAGLTKAEIRSLSRQRGLPSWNSPANACLATRFPYGTRLTAAGLARVEAAEEALREMGDLSQLRVRDHYPVARIEVPPIEIARLACPEVRTGAVHKLQALGYRYVTLDLQGYRMGSLNIGLEIE